jgi:prepilin-type N-terminal cleavage/methylation domain-containing protein
MKNQRGFALIELIAVIVLVGIIASFSAFFLYTGVNGYLNTKTTTEGALNAQMALNRIALELRNISDGISYVEDTSVSFKSEELTGTRTLKYESSSNTIQLNVNNTDYNLLENVPSDSFRLSVNCQDLDDDGAANEIALIDVRFQVGEITKEFKTRVFPRNMAQCPPP